VPAGIFINYRRDDAHGTAGRLRDRLVRDPRSTQVFMDVDNIPAGVDFVDYMNEQVAECDVLLAIIGPDWLHSTDQSGTRRLDNPGDYVRLEIAAALARKIRVVPVLVDGASMPTAEQLPDDLKPLARRNAIELRNQVFGRDADALADNIFGHTNTTAGAVRKTGRWLAPLSVAVALLVAWGGLHQFGIAVPWPASAPAVLTGQELRVVNAQSGKCLTIAGGATFDNNVDAAQIDCNRDDVQRWWLEEPTAGSGIYKIQNVKTTRCLTIAGGTSPENYVRALQFLCDEDPSRTWRLSDAGRGLYQIRNVHTHKCLSIADRDSPENAVRAGAPIQYECENDPASLWTFKPKP